MTTLSLGCKAKQTIVDNPSFQTTYTSNAYKEEINSLLAYIPDNASLVVTTTREMDLDKMVRAYITLQMELNKLPYVLDLETAINEEQTRQYQIKFLEEQLVNGKITNPETIQNIKEQIEIHKTGFSIDQASQDFTKFILESLDLDTKNPDILIFQADSEFGMMARINNSHQKTTEWKDTIDNYIKLIEHNYINQVSVNKITEESSDSVLVYKINVPEKKLFEQPAYNYKLVIRFDDDRASLVISYDPQFKADKYAVQQTNAFNKSKLSQITPDTFITSSIQIRPLYLFLKEHYSDVFTNFVVFFPIPNIMMSEFNYCEDPAENITSNFSVMHVSALARGNETAVRAHVEIADNDFWKAINAGMERWYQANALDKNGKVIHPNRVTDSVAHISTDHDEFSIETNFNMTFAKEILNALLTKTGKRCQPLRPLSTTSELIGNLNMPNATGLSIVVRNNGSDHEPNYHTFASVFSPSELFAPTLETFFKTSCSLFSTSENHELTTFSLTGSEFKAPKITYHDHTCLASSDPNDDGSKVLRMAPMHPWLKIHMTEKVYRTVVASDIETKINATKNGRGYFLASEQEPRLNALASLKEKLNTNADKRAKETFLTLEPTADGFTFEIKLEN